MQLIDKMRSKVQQLEHEAEKGAELQLRVDALQAQADKLPALRTHMYSLQVCCVCVGGDWEGLGPGRLELQGSFVNLPWMSLWLSLRAD